MESVNVEQVKILEANTDRAIVNASLSYLMKNRLVIDSSVRFLLEWDTQNGKWIVREAN